MQQKQNPCFEYKAPTFNKSPLRKEILENMRDIPLQEQRLRYADYTDGILYGCHLYEENGVIGVEPGIVKYRNMIYTLGQRAGVPYDATDEWTVLKIVFRNENSGRDFTRFTGDVLLDSNAFLGPNEMELGRFKLKKGSSLRTSYRDFADMTTEYDTVHLVHVKMAGIDDDTIHPSITWNFGLEAYHSASDAKDISFCSLCMLENRPLSRGLLQQYIFSRVNVAPKRLDNAEIHRLLSEILDGIKRGSGNGTGGSGEQDGMLLL